MQDWTRMTRYEQNLEFNDACGRNGLLMLQPTFWHKTEPCLKPLTWVSSSDVTPTPHQASLVQLWTAVTPSVSRKGLLTHGTPPCNQGNGTDSVRKHITELWVMIQRHILIQSHVTREREGKGGAVRTSRGGGRWWRKWSRWERFGAPLKQRTSRCGGITLHPILMPPRQIGESLVSKTKT